jgi:hypothetical protein
VLLQPDYVKDRETVLFCKKVLQFVTRKRYWPTAMEVHELFGKGCNFSQRSCVMYSKYAIEKGYLEYDKWKHLRLTDKFYNETHTEVVEPSLPSHPTTRAAVKRHRKLESKYGRTNNAGI